MSILLDALRRSEEQRRLGSTPSIHTDPGGGPAAGDAAYQWIPLSLIALSAIAMAWIGWQQYQRPAELAPGGAPAAVEQAAAGGEDAGSPENSGAAERAAPIPATSPVQRAIRRSPVETFTQDEESPQALPDMESGEVPQADAQRARISESVQTYQAESEPVRASQIQGEPESAREAAGPVSEPQARRSAAEDPATQRAASEPITYWELPQGVRDNLPELRITVLVYAEQPEDRFLLVGGQRLVEKDEYEDGVVLDEIRRDGAVFLYRNYRFLVKG